MPFRKNEKIEGKYANYFEVGHNAFEFVIDFGQHYTENEEAELCIRIITSPAYARIFQKILTESIELYEQEFHPIPGCLVGRRVRKGREKSPTGGASFGDFSKVGGSS